MCSLNWKRRPLQTEWMRCPGCSRLGYVCYPHRKWLYSVCMSAVCDLCGASDYVEGAANESWMVGCKRGRLVLCVCRLCVASRRQLLTRILTVALCKVPVEACTSPRLNNVDVKSRGSGERMADILCIISCKFISEQLGTRVVLWGSIQR